MPRRPRPRIENCFYHVLNRSVRRAPLFETSRDYDVFEQALWQALQRMPVKLQSYSAMPNHWHLVVWCDTQRQLSTFMHWLTGTHAQRWHADHATSGTGPVYQGRFKAIPIMSDRQFLAVCRYVERNALAAHLVDRAEDWRWCSLWRRCRKRHEMLCDWPIPVPDQWVDHVNLE
jgi:REP-associated tyrosine transposase